MHGSAYTHMDISMLQPNKCIQINLAGVKCNLLLSGISAILFSFCPNLWTFIPLFINALLSISNLILAEGSDGEHTMALLLGFADLIEGSDTILTVPDVFDYIRRSTGARGYALIITAVSVTILKFTLPLFIIFSICEFIILIL